MQLPDACWQAVKSSIPRLLTQLDRDPESPTCGCFDRDFWHYKIRDFSSMVLQQGLLALDALYHLDMPDNPLFANGRCKEWIEAGLEFWASRQHADGSFDEYYPNEHGYPPTAFSLLAVCLLARDRRYGNAETLIPAINAACNWLLDHPEAQALNQLSAGLAAMTIARNMDGVVIDSEKLDVQLDKFFAAQSGEGWFPEYGGPDTGYLSVTADNLLVIHQETGDARAIEALDKCIRFTASMIAPDNTIPALINARDTDYVAPFAYAVRAERDPGASAVVRGLFTDIGRTTHFFNATDDRYLCHYLGASVFRALPHLDAMTSPAPLPNAVSCEYLYEHAGIIVRHFGNGCSVFSCGPKGGVIYTFIDGRLVDLDAGWRLSSPRGRGVTMWQNPAAQVTMGREEEDILLKTSTAVAGQGWPQSTPLRHVALRMLSAVFGTWLIARLKRMMIFRADPTGVSFQRTIRIFSEALVIEDVLAGAGIQEKQPTAAPAYSLRHVASAARFINHELLSSREETNISTSPGQLRRDKKIALKR